MYLYYIYIHIFCFDEEILAILRTYPGEDTPDFHKTGTKRKKFLSETVGETSRGYYIPGVIWVRSFSTAAVSGGKL